MARSIVKNKGKFSKNAKLGRPLTRLTTGMEDLSRDVRKRESSPLEPLTEAQAEYIASINTNQLTFGIGPAGTGKTYIAAALAADALLDRTIEKIIITRPVIEAGENLGFLPGELSEKIAPYFAPVKAILEKRLGRGAVEMFEKSGRIEFMPLAFLRGHTLDDAFIILDEAQNTTPGQMKLFLTRLGEKARVVIDGDITQIDIQGLSGLSDALRRLRHVKNVNVVTFEESDIVRSGLVRDILAAYRNEVEEQNIIGIEDIVGNWK